MGKTKIEWTRGDDGSLGETWNPVTGCTKVSQGCKHCYAERVFPRAYGQHRVIIPTPADGLAPDDAIRPETATGHWTRPRRFTDVQCHPERLDQPLRWKRPRRVFVNSMSDLFHEDVPDDFIDQVFAVMALCPHHTFQVLTKRPERMREYMVHLMSLKAHLQDTDERSLGGRRWEYGEEFPALPLPNVCLGVSVEDQATADERIPLLLQTPAAVRFVSAEPLLGALNLSDVLQRCCGHCDEPLPLCRSVQQEHNGARCCELCQHDYGLNWVIVGGESGPGARPFDVAWARSIIRQCKAAGVACFVKQLGAWPVETMETSVLGTRKTILLRDRKGGDMDEWPEDLRVREFPA